jgi:hypothetical protein
MNFNTEIEEIEKRFDEKFYYMRPSAVQKARHEVGALNPNDFDDIKAFFRAEIEKLLKSGKRENEEGKESNNLICKDCGYDVAWNPIIHAYQHDLIRRYDHDAVVAAPYTRNTEPEEDVKTCFVCQGKIATPIAGLWVKVCSKHLNDFAPPEPKGKTEKEWEGYHQAFQDFLDVCAKIAGDKSRTGAEAQMALERVKQKHDLLLSQQLAAAEERGRSQEETKQVQDKFRISIETQSLARSQAIAQCKEKITKLSRYQTAEVSKEAYEKCKSDILQALTEMEKEHGEA